MRMVNARAVGGEQAEQVFEQFFPGVVMNAPTASPFEVALDMYATSGGLMFMDYTIHGAMLAQIESPSGVMISLSDVQGRIGVGRDQIDTSQPWVVPHHAYADCDLMHTRIVALSEDAIERHLRALSGGPSSGRFGFTGAAPLTKQHGDYWRGVVGMVQPAMASGAIDDPLLASSITDLLIRSGLTCFPHNWEQPSTGVGLRATAAMQRAKAYIDDHAHEPITVTDIAQAARISPRHLQGEFRRYYETTPMAYLRHARLALAHDALQSADAGAVGATVAAIARAAGFAHLGRFSADYHHMYGEYPRSTLER